MLREIAACADAIGPGQAPVLGGRSPGAVPDDRIRGVDDPLPRSQDSVNHVHVLGALERRSRSKSLVIRPRAPQDVARGGEVAAATDAPGVSPPREDRGSLRSVN